MALILAYLAWAGCVAGAFEINEPLTLPLFEDYQKVRTPSEKRRLKALAQLLLSFDNPSVAWHAVQPRSTAMKPNVESPLWSSLVPRSASPQGAVAAPTRETESIALNDGNFIPSLAMPLYRVHKGEDASQSVHEALEAGYRMIDTAQNQGNEAEIGRAIRESSVPREDIFFQSKLDRPFHGYSEAYRAVRNSLNKTGLDYFDSFLIHNPSGGKLVETWDALLKLQSEGYIRSVGVTNFGLRHLEALEQAGRAMPAINQLEMHPSIYQERVDLVEYCQSKRILIQAYGSVFVNDWYPEHEQSLYDVCAAHPDKTVLHVLVRWAIQKGFQVITVCIPRAYDLLRWAEQKGLEKDSKLRLKRLGNVFNFDLSAPEMDSLSNWRPVSERKHNKPIEDAPVELGDVKAHA